jgi:hypothetical protein
VSAAIYVAIKFVALNVKDFVLSDREIKLLICVPLSRLRAFGNLCPDLVRLCLAGEFDVLVPFKVLTVFGCDNSREERNLGCLQHFLVEI